MSVEVDRLGRDRRPDELLHERLASVNDVQAGAEFIRDALLVFAALVFAEVDTHRVNVTEPRLLQPEQQVGAVQPTAEQGDDRPARIQDRGCELPEGTDDLISYHGSSLVSSRYG